MKYQLDFFQDEHSPMELIRKDVKGIKESSEKVRKSMFAKHGELYKQYTDLNERISLIEKFICCQLSSKCELASM